MFVYNICILYADGQAIAVQLLSNVPLKDSVGLYQAKNSNVSRHLLESQRNNEWLAEEYAVKRTSSGYEP